MSDDPTQTTPGHTELSNDVGARSTYDSTQLSPSDVSAAAFAGTLDKLASNMGASAVSHLDSSGNVRATVTQTPGFPPVTVHTSALGYEIPMGRTTRG